jgi:DNA-directed RNA polymerase specialized sigma24 family protein
MTDLFGWHPPEKPKYPEVPGYKEHTTSKDAAKAMEKRAAPLRDRALSAIAQAGELGMTADEAAEYVGCTVLAMRPRITELRQLNQIVRTKHRRANASGVKAWAWRVP